MYNAIVTKYIPATNIRGARIKASIEYPGESGKLTATVGYSYDLSSESAHYEAVKALLVDLLDLPGHGWHAGYIGDGQYAWVRVRQGEAK